MLYSAQEIAAVAEIITIAGATTRSETAKNLAIANLRSVGISGEEADSHPLSKQVIEAIQKPLCGEVNIDLHEFGDRLKADPAWWNTTECKVIDFLAYH